MSVPEENNEIPSEAEYGSEIEEGEIVSEEEEEEEGIDIASLMTSLMSTPDGDTICSALVNISHQLQTQNKILIKMLSRMNPA